MAKKRTTKKTSNRKPASASASLPQSQDIPEGMRQLGGGYAQTWKPEEPGESIHGTVTGAVREVEFKQGRKTVQRRVMELTSLDGENRFAVWESAALGALFDELSDMGVDSVGQQVYLRFDGLGKKKAGQNPPKLFTVALAA